MVGAGIGTAPIRIAPRTAVYQAGFARDVPDRLAADFVAVGIERQQGKVVGGSQGPCIDDVEHRVEALRHRELELTTLHFVVR
jgi:hypothetical protein